MDEGQKTVKLEGEGSRPAGPTHEADVWQEVGEQFGALGASLAKAFNAAWTNEDNRRRAQEMRVGLESMVNQVGQAINEASVKPEVQQARGEVSKAAGSIREAGEQAVQEVRPHLLAALSQLNEELHKLVDRLEGGGPGTGAGSGQVQP